MKPGKELYRGKAKTIYATDDPEQVILSFRDDATAFNAEKHAQFVDKGKINNLFNAHVQQLLAKQHINTHFIQRLSDTDSLVKRLEIIPLEAVVRNVAAGSLCKRLGIEQGQKLKYPLFEFFYKDDALGDPFVNDDHILLFGWASQQEIDWIKSQSLQINIILQHMFDQANLQLVDFKLEFGRFHGEILLGDEITPDGCRLWDKDSGESFDKDRFRHDKGDLISGYQQVMQRLGIAW